MPIIQNNVNNTENRAKILENTVFLYVFFLHVKDTFLGSGLYTQFQKMPRAVFLHLFINKLVLDMFL